METRALIVLIGLVVIHALMTWRELHEYRVFQGLEASADRRRVLRMWLVRSLLFHGLAAVAVLIGMDRAGALLRLPPELAGPAAALQPGRDGALGGVLRGAGMVLPAVLLLMPTSMTVIDVRRRTARGERLRDDPAVQARNAASLFPRNPHERRLLALVSLNAGVSEELFFRLLLPVLTALATGSAWAGVAVGTVAFGLAHLYQGAVGVAATMVVGVLLMVVYLMTGQLWLVIVIHALLDLNSLVLAPWLEARWLGEDPASA